MTDLLRKAYGISAEMQLAWPSGMLLRRRPRRPRRPVLRRPVLSPLLV